MLVPMPKLTALSRSICPAIRVIVHPPRDESLRAHCKADAQFEIANRTFGENLEYLSITQTAMKARGSKISAENIQFWYQATLEQRDLTDRAERQCEEYTRRLFDALER